MIVASKRWFLKDAVHIVNEFIFQSTPEPSPLELMQITLLQRDLRNVIETDLAIESIQTPRDPKREGVVLFRGRLLRPSHVAFARWQTELARRGFTPTLSSEIITTGR